MSWFINGVKEWATDYTTTFNTTQSTTTTFSTSRSTTTTFSTSQSTTTTFSTSRSTTTTFSTSKSTTTTFSGTQYPTANETPENFRWIRYDGNAINAAHILWDGVDVGSGANAANPINLSGFTYYRGNSMTNPNNHGTCCGGINYDYYNINRRTGTITSSFTTTFNTSATTTTTFNTTQSTTTTFNTTQSTTTTFNTTRSTTTTFSTSRTTERTTNFYA